MRPRVAGGAVTWRCWRHRNHLVQPPGGWRCNHLLVPAAPLETPKGGPPRGKGTARLDTWPRSGNRLGRAPWPARWPCGAVRCRRPCHPGQGRTRCRMGLLPGRIARGGATSRHSPGPFSSDGRPRPAPAPGKNLFHFSPPGTPTLAPAAPAAKGRRANWMRNTAAVQAAPQEREKRPRPGGCPPGRGPASGPGGGRPLIQGTGGRRGPWCGPSWVAIMPAAPGRRRGRGAGAAAHLAC
jgi:hypothetical protein